MSDARALPRRVGVGPRPVPGRWEGRAVMQAPESPAPPRTGPTDWRTSCPSRDWWMSPAGGARRPRRRVTGRGPRRRTRGCASRSAYRRGDHPGDARGRPGPVCGQAPGADCDPVARRLGDQRSARAHRDGSGPEDRVGAGPAGKGGKRRIVAMDDCGWEHVASRTEHRVRLPSARCSASSPDQLRHAHAIEMAHEGIPLPGTGSTRDRSLHGTSKIRPFTCPASIWRCASGACSSGRTSV
jgi:hypothetical protein